jgi:hypothetical protein
VAAIKAYGPHKYAQKILDIFADDIKTRIAALEGVERDESYRAEELDRALETFGVAAAAYQKAKA